MVTCAYPQCNETNLKEKCIDCGKTYCISHIQLFPSRGYVCDVCVRETAQAAQLLAQAAQAKVRREAAQQAVKDKKLNQSCALTIVALLISLGLCASVFTVLAPTRSLIIPIAMILAIAFLIFGIIMGIRFVILDN